MQGRVNDNAKKFRRRMISKASRQLHFKDLYSVKVTR